MWWGLQPYLPAFFSVCCSWPALHILVRSRHERMQSSNPQAASCTPPQSGHVQHSALHHNTPWCRWIAQPTCLQRDSRLYQQAYCACVRQHEADDYGDSGSVVCAVQLLVLLPLHQQLTMTTLSARGCLVLSLFVHNWIASNSARTVTPANRLLISHGSHCGQQYMIFFQQTRSGSAT